MEILYGLHPVEEALRSGNRKFDHVCVARDRTDQRLQRVIDTCRESGVRLRFEAREELTRLAKTSGHQGVVAIVRTREFLELEDLFEACLFLGPPSALKTVDLKEPTEPGFAKELARRRAIMSGAGP